MPKKSTQGAGRASKAKRDSKPPKGAVRAPGRTETGKARSRTSAARQDKVKLPVRGAGSAARLASRPKLSRAPAAAAATVSPRGKLDSARRQAALLAAESAIDAALDKKALVPVLLDVSAQASYTDFIAIVSARNDRQVLAIAEHIEARMKEQGRTLIGREGQTGGRWSLLDFGDFVVHVFFHPVREIYDIEGLWVEAPRIALRGVPPEALHVQSDALYAVP